MPIKRSLLAILDQGPCYGYQLRSEFERRTGDVWALNVGQVYSTLERLERDNLVAKDERGDNSQVFYEITQSGRDEVANWFNTPVERDNSARDELTIKLAIAATLPGVDITRIIQAQRRASLNKLQSLNRAKYSGANPNGPEELAWSLMIDAMIFATEADVRWLDHSEQRLKMQGAHTMELTLDQEPAKRGRPKKSETISTQKATTK